MANHTLKILRYEHRKIFKVWLAILQHYAWKGKTKFFLKEKKLVKKKLKLCINPIQDVGGGGCGKKVPPY